MDASSFHFLSRNLFDISWVPSHGRARERPVPDFWGPLNKHAAEAAADCSLRASVGAKEWALCLNRRRLFVLKLLRFKAEVFDSLRSRLVARGLA